MKHLIIQRKSMETLVALPTSVHTQEQNACLIYVLVQPPPT